MSAITPAPLERRFSWRPQMTEQTLFTPIPAPMRASGAMRGCGLDVSIIVAVESGADEAAIRYSSIALVDRNGTELLAFHHHPGSAASAPAFPHVHVSAALRPASFRWTSGICQPGRSDCRRWSGC
jgi:hypothetical protein